MEIWFHLAVGTYKPTTIKADNTVEVAIEVT